MKSNIFEPSYRTAILKIVNLWRLNTLLPTFIFQFVFRRTSLETRELYYYFLVLANSGSIHVKNLTAKYLFRLDKQFITARKGKMFSDLENYNQIFGREDYFPVIKLFQDNFKNKQPIIFDIGANVGFASLYFKKQFPNAKIIAVEPDFENFSILKDNFIKNNIDTSGANQFGVWDKTTYLKHSNLQTELGSWAYTFEESPTETEISAKDFVQFIKGQTTGYIDILKIDIEGTEGVLFRDENYMKDLLLRTKVIAIEIHSHLVDSEKIINQLKECDFELFEVSDMTVGFNKNIHDY